MNLDIETIRAHIADRIDASALKMKPFPYLVIEEFFPKEIFDMLLEHNPFSHDEGKEWISKKAQLLTKNKTPYHLRNQINFYENQEFDSPEETKKLWETIQRVFLEDYWFVELIHKKFPEYFDIRFGNFFKKSNYKHFESQMFLQRHQESYSIGPHTDIANRIFTCIFALASETGYEQYGTEILEPLESNESCWGITTTIKINSVLWMLHLISQIISCCSLKQDIHSMLFQKSHLIFQMEDMVCNFNFMSQMVVFSKIYHVIIFIQHNMTHLLGNVQKLLRKLRNLQVKAPFHLNFSIGHSLLWMAFLLRFWSYPAHLWRFSLS